MQENAKELLCISKLQMLGDVITVNQNTDNHSIKANELAIIPLIFHVNIQIP